MNGNELQEFEQLQNNIEAVRQEGIAKLKAQGVEMSDNDSLSDIIKNMSSIGAKAVYIESISAEENVITYVKNNGVVGSFTIPVVSHNHVINDINGLQLALNEKAAQSHTHAKETITGLETALSEKSDISHTHTVSSITDFPQSMPASDVSAWAKESTKPSYTAAEVGADVQGAANTALTNAKSYTDTKISDLINGAPTTLDTLGEIAEAMADNQNVVEALNTAIGTKANVSDLTAHTGNTSNPHSVTKAQIGLENVGNFKAVSTEAGQGLTESEKANARTNIGAGASSFSGDYNDLANKPTIPAAVTESTVSGWGFTKNTGTYSKPSGGIPKSDLTTAVQTSLGKADTALQEHQSLSDYVKTTDSRLSDARTPKTHTHTKSEITDFPTIPTKTSQLTNDSGFKTTDTTYGVATQSANGLMSAADKKKLDGLGGSTSPFVISRTAPSDTTKFWVHNGVLKYYNGSAWAACLATLS